MALPPGASGSAVTGSQINTALATCKAAFSRPATLFASGFLNTSFHASASIQYDARKLPHGGVPDWDDSRK